MFFCLFSLPHKALHWVSDFFSGLRRGASSSDEGRRQKSFEKTVVKQQWKGIEEESYQRTGQLTTFQFNFKINEIKLDLLSVEDALQSIKVQSCKFNSVKRFTHSDSKNFDI